MKHTSILTGLLCLVIAIWGLSGWLRYWNFFPPSLNSWGFGCDSQAYWDLSGNLLQRRGFVDSPGMGHAFSGYVNNDYTPNVVRLPAYPVALMMIRSVWNSNDAPYALNLICFLVLIYYAYRLAKLWFVKEGFSVVYTIILAISPVYLVYLQGVQSDLFSGALASGFVYHLYRIEDSNHKFAWLHVAACSFYGSAAVLSRPNLLVFVIPLIGLEILSFLSSRKLQFHLIMTVVIIGLAMMGWSFRNYWVSGHFALSNLTGYNLFLNYVYYTPPSEFTPWKYQARVDFMKEIIWQGYSPAFAEFELDAELRSQVLRYAKHNTSKIIITGVKSVVGIFLDSYFDLADILAAKIFHVDLFENHLVRTPEVKTQLRVFRGITFGYRLMLLIAFSLYPFVLLRMRLWRSRQMRLWLSCALFVLATGAVLNAGDRLLLPIHAFVMLEAFELIGFFLKIDDN